MVLHAMLVWVEPWKPWVADISTIGSNPAGIGLFRHSNVSLSAGLLMQSDGKEFSNGKKTNLSFDQIGGVYTTRTGQKVFP